MIPKLEQAVEAPQQRLAHNQFMRYTTTPYYSEQGEKCRMSH